MEDSVLKTEPTSGWGGGALPGPAAGPLTLGWGSKAEIPVQFQMIPFQMLIIVVSSLHDG
jgi:hypothetical protein